jgi:hypothetical protein
LLKQSILYESNRVISTFSESKVKKRRSEFYYSARRSLFKVVDLGKSFLDTDLVIDFFDSWRSHYKNQWLRLHRNIDDKYVFMKSVSRFDVDYRNVLRRRLNRLQGVRFDLKLEFTLDPKKFLSLGDEFLFLPPFWHVIHSWLTKRYGKFEFLRIVEIQKKGRPHLHVLCSFYDEKSVKFFAEMKKHRSNGSKNKAVAKCTCNFCSFYNDLKAESLKHGGGWVWAKPIMANNDKNYRISVSKYALKYVNKSLKNSSRSDRKYGALLFASNKRLFSISKGLQVLCGKKKAVKQGYEYQGTVHNSVVKAFCEDQVLPQFAFGHVCYKVDDRSVLYRYKKLFGFE